MLRCQECGRTAESEVEAQRWRAVLIGGYDEGPKEVLVFCPNCAEREFGERREK